MYVVFEGIDGAGKTTQIPLVQQYLSQWKGERYFEKLRIITIAEEEIKPSPNSSYPNKELAFKYALQRLPLQKKIEENNHNIVISDRSYISSMAYQGLCDNHYWVKELNNFMTIPDLVVFFVSNPQSPYLEQVQDNYKHILDYYNFNYIVVTPKTESITQTTDIISRKVMQLWEQEYKKEYERKVYYQ